MGNAFSTLLNRVHGFDRHYGGTSASIVADPYISGYHYSYFTTLPAILEDLVDHGDGLKASEDIGSIEEMKEFLASASIAVTPPGGTLNKTEFIGLGGIKWSVPTNIDYGNTLTMKFIEFSSLPVLGIFHAWVRAIRDYKAGISHLDTDEEAYTKSAYAGSLLYYTTKPDGVTVEYSALYTGVFPTRDPQDMYAGDLSAVDKLEIDIEFNCDWIWHEQWVHDMAQSRSDTIHEQGKAMGGYRGDNEVGDGNDTESV